MPTFALLNYGNNRRGGFPGQIKQSKMNAILKATKKNLENVLSSVAGIDVEITFARTNMVTICWDGENETAFEKLQKYFSGKLYGYEFDAECELSVCCLNIK